MNNPFIPFKKADIAIVAGNANEEIIENLSKRNIRVIKTIGHKKVHSSVKYHPDIVIHPIDHKSLVIEPSVFAYYKEQFEDTGIDLIRGERELDCKYPLDIGYNVGRVGDLAIHNFKYTDEVLKYHLKKLNLELLSVKQGYTKCSIALIGENHVITADRLIDEALKDRGVSSLLIEQGHIYLQDQNYGFIGGSTGNISNKEVALSGNIKHHPDQERIRSFISSANKEIIYLSKEKISDIGTIITLNCN